jgi:Cu/Ag efflux pump CusA
VSNYLDVSADIAGRDAGAVVDDVEAAIAGVTFPLEHHAEIRGAASDPDASPSQIPAVAVTSAIAIFLLLQAAFLSWRLAILAFATLPIAIAGGIVAAAIGGGTIGLGAFAGLLAVLGLTARSVVLTIRHYQRLEREGADTFGDELILRGTQDRFLPTVVGALGTIVALVPLVVLGDVAGLEIARPMAIVMIGGLVTSTLLTLFVLPPLYRMHGFVAQRDTVTDDLIVLPEAAVEVEPMAGY